MIPKCAPTLKPRLDAIDGDSEASQNPALMQSPTVHFTAL
jgi:hypothetical protein